MALPLANTPSYDADVAAQLLLFPETRYMGSKYQLLPALYSVLNELNFESALDAFSGSAPVAYMLKAMGKKVRANDHLRFCYHFADAMVANTSCRLAPADAEDLCRPNRNARRFIRRTFKDLYYTDAENSFLDNLSANIRRLPNRQTRSVALAATVRACMKRRPRGIFTYVGHRYDDGRNDLRRSLHDHFLREIENVNRAVFDSGQRCDATCVDTLRIRGDFDLVYLDPPYISRLSDNDYTRRYHFVEGLVRDWAGLTIQTETLTKKFLASPTPFRSPHSAEEAFERVFRKFADSTIVLSYSSTGVPARKDLVRLLKRVKRHVEVVAFPHQYSFGTHAHKLANAANRIEEYVFIAE